MTNSVSCDYDFFKNAPKFAKCHFFNLSGKGVWSSSSPYSLNAKRETMTHVRKSSLSGFNIPGPLSEKEVVDSVVWRKDAEKPAKSSGPVPVGSLNGTLDKAVGLLGAAKGHMKDRASTYDAPQGECSMGATVKAFNAMTGHQLTEEQGWMFMETLKMVRSQQGDYRPDNYEDAVAYAAFRGAAAAQRDKK